MRILLVVILYIIFVSCAVVSDRVGKKRRAVIYRPSKTVTQSGCGARDWVLKFCSKESKYVEPLMGWIGTCDTDAQLILKFGSQELAESYAQKNEIEYNVILPQQEQIKPKSYSDNFQ